MQRKGRTIKQGQSHKKNSTKSVILHPTQNEMVLDVAQQTLRLSCDGAICDDTGQITLPLESALDLIQSIQLDLDCYQTIRNELQTGRNQSIYQNRAKVSRIFELFKQVVITEQKRNPHRNIILSALFRKTMNIWLQINRNERGHSIWP